MGILNLSPDSFYKESRVGGTDALLQMAGKMLEEGATILDLGAQSTRPGSARIGEDEELNRMTGAVETILRRFPDAILSIDTYLPAVAKYAIEAGAAIVNDISGSDDMIAVAGSMRVPYVCMHLRGNPETMHQQQPYTDIANELIDYFVQKLDVCYAAEVNDVIIDPGFGFSKTIEDNFRLLSEMDKLSVLQRPILAGISRKGTIYKTLGVSVDEALNGTTVLNTVALLKGAKILRVHDVKEAMEVVKLVESL